MFRETWSTGKVVQLEINTSIATGPTIFSLLLIRSSIFFTLSSFIPVSGACILFCSNEYRFSSSEGLPFIDSTITPSWKTILFTKGDPARSLIVLIIFSRKGSKAGNHTLSDTVINKLLLESFLTRVTSARSLPTISFH